MAQEDYRFSISAEKYLERHEVLGYMEDAVQQLLEHREENPKVNPTKFFSDYFSSVKEGNHVLFREYTYVSATSHNRASFVRMFWKCFRHIGRKGDLLNIKEYHSLLCLLCPDFPFQPVQKTARIVLMDDAMDCLISFGDFLYAFQAQFCYEEFLTRCADVYKSLIEEPHTPRETVVVPTSDPSPKPQVHRNNGEGSSAAGEASSDGVDSMVYYRALIPVVEKLDLRAPPLPLLRDILSSAKRVTFYGFLMALSKSEDLNGHIGKLPDKIHLLEVPDQELTSPIRPNSGAKPRPPVPPPLQPAIQKNSTSEQPLQQPVVTKVPTTAVMTTGATTTTTATTVTATTTKNSITATVATTTTASITKTSEVKVTSKQGHTEASTRSNRRRTLAAAKAKRQRDALASSSDSDSSSTN